MLLITSYHFPLKEGFVDQNKSTCKKVLKVTMYVVGTLVVLGVIYAAAAGLSSYLPLPSFIAGSMGSTGFIVGAFLYVGADIVGALALQIIRRQNIIKANSISHHTGSEDAPVVDFIPHFTFRSSTDLDFTTLKLTLQPFLIGMGMSFRFIDDKEEIIIGHSEQEIMAAVYKSNINIRNLFVISGYRNVFTDYATPLGICARDPSSVPEQLLEEAKLFFQNCSFEKLGFSKELEDIDLTDSPGDIFVSMISKNIRGLFIGESHDSSSPKKLLIENMKKLKKQGVKTLFLEHMCYDTSMQEKLDEYLRSNSDSMPPLLEAFLGYLDEGFRIDDKANDFTALVRAAKKAGIRIVGIDTVAAYRSGSSQKYGVTSYKDRVLSLNYIAQKIIKKEKGDGKFVALIGNLHGTTTEGVPGIPEILNCPNLWVMDSKREKQKIERNYSEEIQGCLLRYDIMMSLN